MQESPSNSPCDGNCYIDTLTQLCRGCYRTINEIISWTSASEEQRKNILDLVEIRKFTAQKDRIE
jgi:uncharacterized protein